MLLLSSEVLKLSEFVFQAKILGVSKTQTSKAQTSDIRPRKHRPSEKHSYQGHRFCDRHTDRFTASGETQSHMMRFKITQISNSTGSIVDEHLCKTIKVNKLNSTKSGFMLKNVL